MFVAFVVVGGCKAQAQETTEQALARAAQGKVAERREFVDLLDKVVALAKAAP